MREPNKRGHMLGRCRPRNHGVFSQVFALRVEHDQGERLAISKHKARLSVAHLVEQHLAQERSPAGKGERVRHRRRADLEHQPNTLKSAGLTTLPRIGTTFPVRPACLAASEIMA